MAPVEADQGAAQDGVIVVRNASKLFLDGAVVAFRQLSLDGRSATKSSASSARAAAARPRCCAASRA